MNTESIRKKCAEIVGWHKHDCGAPLCWKFGTGIMGITRSIHDLPNYPESADAALELVEWMNKKRAITTIEISGSICKVKLRTAETSQVFAEQAETLPLAVCLSFLKANGINPETL